MFEQLSDKLNTTFERLRGRARVSESDLEEALRDVRVALLEADVNFKVVRQLVATVRERALGEKVLESISGAQQVGPFVVTETKKPMEGDDQVAAVPATHRQRQQKQQSFHGRQLAASRKELDTQPDRQHGAD